MPRRYYRDVPPSFGGGGEGRGGTIGDLIIYGGQAQADNHLRSGDLWANAIAQAGQALSGGFQQAAVETEAKAERDRLSKQDQAFMARLSDTSRPLDPREILSIYGPDRGMKIAQGIDAFQSLDQKRGEEAAKSLPGLIRGMDALSEPMRAQFYPSVRQKAVASGLVPEDAIPEQYDPEAWGQISAYGKAISGEKKPEPIKARPGDVFLDPSDPSKQLAAIPPEPEKPQPFTLSPGETRYGADGQPVASRPANPPAPSREKFWVIRDGKPLRVSEAEYRPGDQPANTREQGRPVTSGDSSTIADLDSSLDDLNTLSGQITKKGATGTLAKAGAMAPNWVTEWTGFGEDAKKKQALIDGVKQVIGKALEGGVLRKEDEYKYEKILPTIGDVPSVVQSKLDGLWKRIQQKRQTFLESKADAGYDVTKFTERPPRQQVPPGGDGPARIQSDADYDALPSGAQFIAPDGTLRRKP